MARKTFHRKDGRFSSYIAAHTVSDGGKRFELVRSLKPYGSAQDDGKDNAAPQPQVQAPRVDVVGGIQAAKDKAAMISGAVSMGGWVPVGAVAMASAPPATESFIGEGKFRMGDYPTGFEAVQLMKAVFSACSSSGEKWPRYSGPYAELAGKKDDEKVTLDDMRFAEAMAKEKNEKGILRVVREALKFFKGRES